MKQPSNPTAHRRTLGKELRRLREAAGKSTVDAAAALKCHPSRVSRIETGRGTAVAKEEDVHKLCDLYGITDERMIGALTEMVNSSQKRGWWQEYDGVLPSGVETLVGMEATARTGRAWEPLVVPGLMQTPEYARALFESERAFSPEDIEDQVHVRVRRADRLTSGDQPLELWAVVDESVLRRTLGGPAVMRDQLTHLLSVMDLPNVTIQTFPSNKPTHPGLSGSFSLFAFDDEPETVYIDSQAGNIYLEKSRDIRRFTAKFDLLRAHADDPTTSRALIASVAKET